MDDLDKLPTDQLLARAGSAARGDATGEADERWQFTWELHRRPETAVFETALTWCAEPVPALRCLGADVLGQLGNDDPRPFAAASTPVLSAMLGDPEEVVVAAALVALGHLDAGDPAAICACLPSASAAVRQSVAYCLGGHDDELSIAALIELSADAEAAVRNWATFGLGALSDVDTPAIRDALVVRLKDADHEVRGEAMVGLAVREDPRVLPAILAELQRENVSVLAVEAAAEFPDRGFLAPLLGLLEEAPDDEGIALAVERCRAEPESP